jgi:hypothetical protein
MVNDEIHMSVLQWAERLRDRKIIGSHHSRIHLGEIIHTFCLAQ